jgi:RimJ/RimL family protein N-acetyltransferase
MPAIPAIPVEAERLLLEPLHPDHAREAAITFADPALHRHIGGAPMSEPDLRDRYRRLAAGHSPDGSEQWLNWMVRTTSDGALVGTVQATVELVDGIRSASLAWVTGTAHQGRGFAKEAAGAALAYLRGREVDRFTAHIHPENLPSEQVARFLGLEPRDTWSDGERLWSDDAPAS